MLDFDDLMRPQRSRERHDHAALIKGWVRERFALSDDMWVMVSELACREPGCPPVETVIALLGGLHGPAQHRILKPMEQVTEADVLALPDTPLTHEHEP